MNAIEKHVLVVTSDHHVSTAMQPYLEGEFDTAGYLEEGRAGLQEVREGHWDLLLLDSSLPDLSGLEVCRTLRGEGFRLPIIMLAEHYSELDEVLALEIGADDYVTKPFSEIGLRARARSQLRRIELNQCPAKAPKLLENGDVSINPSRRDVRVRGRSIALTVREFDLLIYFAQHPDQVFDRTKLMDEVWGRDHDGYAHAVNVLVNRLRGKIERDPKQPKLIATVRGVGYRFQSGERDLPSNDAVFT